MVKKANDDIIKKTIRLYSGLGWKSFFARIRLWDAPYVQAEAMLPKEGMIVELGCGEGLFSNYLALGSKRRKIIGIEVNRSRLKQADRGLSNTRFILGDVTKAKIPSADAIVLMHVLHHLDSFKKQEELLKMCSSKLESKGRLMVIEIEPKISLKYFITFLADHFVVAWLFEKKLFSAIYFRKRKEWIALLNRMGFKVKPYSADKNKPFSHIIFDCKKL